MNAKEMFKQLGYHYNYSQKIENDIRIEEEIKYQKESLEVIFECTSKNIFALRGSIGMNELKAINKQVEELGWLDEIDISKIPTIGHIDSDGHIILPKNEKW